jgi:hypothetical protein
LGINENLSICPLFDLVAKERVAVWILSVTFFSSFLKFCGYAYVDVAFGYGAEIEFLAGGYQNKGQGCKSQGGVK